MLSGVRLKVTFTYERSCFGYISSKYSSINEQSQCIQILSKEKPIILWAVFSNTVPEGHIACNPIYSKLLGLEEGLEVFVSPYGDAKMLNELYVDADSPDDQEILEHNVEILQFRILDQLRLVVAEQKAVVWISSSLPIVFTPKQTGILVNESRIYVKVDAFNSIHGSPQNIPANTTNDKDRDTKFNCIGQINDSMLAPYFNISKRLVLRALPIDSDGKKNLIHPYSVFIHEDLLSDIPKDLTVILATLTKIPSIMQGDREDEEVDNSNQVNGICVEIVPIENVIYRSLCREVYNKNIPTVLIPKNLNAIVSLENGMKIVFTILGDTVEQPEHIDIVTYCDKVQNETEVIEKFKKCVVENTHSGKKFLINDNMVKQNSQISNGFLTFKLKPDKIKYTMLNSESFRHCTVSAKCLSDADLVLPKPVASNLEYDYKNYCRTMKSKQKLVEKIIAHINFEIQREANFKGVSEIKSNILITGSSGCGKSALCHIVQKEITMWSYLLHCRSLKGRKDIPEVIGKAILMCQEHSPAVLICDDFDSLVPPNLEGTSPQDIAYYQRLAVCIKKMLQTCVGVCVLLSASSVKDLHPTLKQFNGKPLFTAHFDLPEMDQDERAELFRHLLNDKIKEIFQVEDDDVMRLAMDTPGYNVRDIVDYFNKKVFKAVKKKKAYPEQPIPRLVEDAAKDEEKSKAFDIWGTVGGMDNVKQQLTECIFWPLIYPSLFPARGCGVLLYGPPGSGKSLLGSCLAQLGGVKIILVKGPELLSKYIGQSERAVRDVFDKAEMQRPCILFFDEFDSLAPKRGHDSTGVTDRVVNQLLARLDGAEGAPSGPVLAATSRPDLLDPALLRAGRIQTHVYCALPDRQGRYEVLKTLSTSVTMDESVDLEDLGEKTEGYSPADLKALLVTAQLGRLERQLVNSENRNVESVVVNEEDITIALKETKPSLTREQRLFYDTIYKRFRGEKLTAEQRLVARQMARERVTLA